jgi:tRNA threonylcarbamoyladenosine biosynthesis protein TsaB
VYLSDRNGKHYLNEIDEANQHSKELAVMIQEILTQAKMNTTDLDAVCISIGPGSYTGLRVGLATAKAICYVHDIPLISLGSLEILVQAGMDDHEHDYIIPMIDARRMEVYTAIFDGRGRQISPAEAMIIEEGSFEDRVPKDSSILLLGNGSGKAHPVLSYRKKFLGTSKTSARYMIRLAQKYFQREQIANLSALTPQYLKSPNITKPKKKL